ncbi:hypothetical protein [Streptosporangium sp. LJ11]|uniref:hypothetical protein n=1 Tax=Streptosporangium sp. LJ11 TaxID=3436927 RepID=UPI003F7A864A
MQWTIGEAAIRKLLDNRELQSVPLADHMAESMLESARNHLESVELIRDTDPDGAYALCYDAARKASAALLQAQGLRATSAGGHIALREAVTAQFGQTREGAPLRRLDHMRRRRNVLEYSGQPSEAVTGDELDEATTWTAEIIDFCERLVPRLGLFP